MLGDSAFNIDVLVLLRRIPGHSLPELFALSTEYPILTIGRLMTGNVPPLLGSMSASDDARLRSTTDSSCTAKGWESVTFPALPIIQIRLDKQDLSAHKRQFTLIRLGTAGAPSNYCDRIEWRPYRGSGRDAMPV